jgi:hypothetical protein
VHGVAAAGELEEFGDPINFARTALKGYRTSLAGVTSMIRPWEEEL